MTPNFARVSDDAITAATGRTWAQWIAALDRVGAATKTHKEIVALVHGEFDVDSGWWCQTVTVGYEQAKGLRAVYQKSDGFAANTSRTLGAPADRVFAAWNDARRRRSWLPYRLTVRKATRGRSLRITWGDGTNVVVYLVVKGSSKTQIAIEHSKLADAKAVAAMKAYWTEALGRLAARLDAEAK